MTTIARFIRLDDIPRVEAESALEAIEVFLDKPMKMGQVQKTLGVKSPTTIKKWIAIGRFPNAFRLNGQWRIPAADVFVVQQAGLRASALALEPSPRPMGEYEGDPFEDPI